MRKIKKALPIALVIMALFSLLALGVSAYDYSQGDGHDCNFIDPVTYPATCVEDGYIVYQCCYCGIETDTGMVTLPATGHTYSSSVTKQATCTASGTIEYTCQNCGDFYTETIPASHGNEVPKSKGAEGHVYGCEYCDALDSEIQLHMFTTSPNVCATCGYVKSECDHSFVYKSNSAETHILTCSKCGMAKGEEIGHVWSNRTQMEQGKDEYHYIFKYTCSVCNATKTQEESIVCSSEGDHNWLYWNIDGQYHYQACTTCGETRKKTVHTFGDGVVLQSPSLNVEGITRYTCTLCNYYKEEVVPALNINDVLNRCTNKEAVQLFDALYNKFKPAINAESSTVTILEMSGLSEFAKEIFADILNNGEGSKYYDDYVDIYSSIQTLVQENSSEYQRGYNDAIGSVIDKNPIQGLIQGMWSSVILFITTVGNGVAIGGISFMSVLMTILILALVWFLIKTFKG